MTVASGNARDVEAALRKRWPSDAFALLFQVPNGTGGHKTRTADALAFGLWPSRGLDIEGVEVKVSRSDWRKEIEDPTKAEAFSRYCHRWWIATVPGVVETGELPPQWGLLELQRGALRQVVEAPRTQPEAMPHRSWVAVMRAVQNTELVALRAEQRRIEESAQARAEAQIGDRLTSITAAVEAFKEATGIDVRYQQWNLDRISAALALVDEGRSYNGLLASMSGLPDRLRRMADELAEALPEPACSE